MVSEPKAAEMRDIVALLSEALELSDCLGETLLGAKIDEALECARAISARC